MRVLAVIKRILTQMIRDKRTLALMFIAPLLILTLMYFLFNSDASELKLGVINVDKATVEDLEESGIEVIEYTKANNDTIKKDNLGGLLEIKDGKLNLKLQNSDTAVSKALEIKINGALTSKAMKNLISSVKPNNIISSTIDISYLYGNKNTNFFDIINPILIGYFVFFFVFIISGIGLLRERTTGTLERLISTPIKRWEIVTGYLVGYGIFAVLQTFLVVFYAINVLNITVVGSIWNVILVNLLTAFLALALGILLSTFASSEFQMIQFIPVVIIPQIFFAGIIPLENMAKWIRVIAKIMPMYYVGNALKGVMYKGYGLDSIMNEVLIILLFAVAFVGLNIQALKKYRKL